MPIIRIDSVDDPRVSAYCNLTGRQLRSRQHPDDGVIIVESPKVIRVALKAGLKPLSLLCEEKHVTGDAADIIRSLNGVPVYTGSRTVLSSLTGYTLTRGVLCAMHRPPLPALSSVCAKATRIAVINGVVDSTNIGTIFRSAAALGMDAVVVTDDSCDPLCRRAIRVSMGSVFLVPWTRTDSSLSSLRSMGFKTVAMALRDDSVRLDSPILKSESKLAIVVGTEGEGLPQSFISSADYVVRIPMAYGVDSLNVSAASAIAFWELGKKL